MYVKTEEISAEHNIVYKIRSLLAFAPLQPSASPWKIKLINRGSSSFMQIIAYHMIVNIHERIYKSEKGNESLAKALWQFIFS